ncbi:hypothetical protein ACHAXH_007010 [Discostella pseudostelligera]
MGNCLSISSVGLSNFNHHGGEDDHHQSQLLRDQQPKPRQPLHQQQHRQRRNDHYDGYSGNNDAYIQSMARVGSRVYTHNPNISTLEEHRASTYQHVHELVEQGIIEALCVHNDTTYANTTTAAATTTTTTTNTHDIDGSTHDDLSSGKVGLTNLGNTCFMNCSLQCLSNTVPLTDYFLGYDFRSEINYENFLGTKGALVSAYAELIKHIWLGSNKIYRPSKFKYSLEQFAPQFVGNEQHDAHELLAYLLDGMHEDLNRVKRSRKSTNASTYYIQDNDCDGTNDEGDAIIAWSNYLQRNQSILVDLFQGQLRNTMTCRNRISNSKTESDGYCGHVNVKFDPFMYLSLPISDDCRTLDDCLDLFCEEEFLTGDERWFCPKCQQLVNASKKIDLFMLPPILIIHLKRFKFNPTSYRWTKIDQSVSYPVNDWDLSEVMKKKRGNSTTNNRIDPMYDLYAISHHEGDVGYGHYTAQTKNRFDGEWYTFNDSQCHRKVVNHKQDYEASSSAYCLFYNRVERVVGSSTADDDSGGDVEKKTIIRRQSISRPELWPHLQRENAAYWKSTRFN